MTDRELNRAVEAWGQAHRDELARDIILLVNQKSVSQPGQGGYAFGEGCKACADKMASLAEAYGFPVDNDDYYTLSILRKGSESKELGILGHLDVVPEGQGWTYEPYGAVEKDGFIIGRGSSDNKGAVTMALYVLRALDTLGIVMKHTVRLICGFNEESGMQDVEHYLKTHRPPEYTLVCDGGWAMCIGEKGIVNAELSQTASDGNLRDIRSGTATNAVPGTALAVLEHADADKIAELAAPNGRIRVSSENGLISVMALGKAGHAAFPQSSDNALLKLVRFLAENQLVTGECAGALRNISDLFVDDYATGLGAAYEDQLSGKTTCVASVLALEEGILTLKMDMRFAITQNTEELIDRLRKTCRSKSVSIRSLTCSPPRYTDPDSPIAKMLLKTVHEFLGEEYKAYTMGGGTHARRFPSALPFGPGGLRIENPFGSAHGPDEAVSLDAMIRAMGVYAVALKRLDEMTE